MDQKQWGKKNNIWKSAGQEFYWQRRLKGSTDSGGCKLTTLGLEPNAPFLYPTKQI